MRDVHRGCREALDKYASLAPVLDLEEGSTVGGGDRGACPPKSKSPEARVANRFIVGIDLGTTNCALELGRPKRATAPAIACSRSRSS